MCPLVGQKGPNRAETAENIVLAATASPPHKSQSNANPKVQVRERSDARCTCIEGLNESILDEGGPQQASIRSKQLSTTIGGILDGLDDSARDCDGIMSSMLLFIHSSIEGVDENSRFLCALMRLNRRQVARLCKVPSCKICSCNLPPPCLIVLAST